MENICGFFKESEYISALFIFLDMLQKSLQIN